MTVLQTCELHCPNKVHHQRKHNPKRRVLTRRRKKIRARIRCIKDKRPDSPVIERLEAELESIHQQMKDSILEQKALDEEKAVKAIQENPKYFYTEA